MLIEIGKLAICTYLIAVGIGMIKAGSKKS